MLDSEPCDWFAPTSDSDNLVFAVVNGIGKKFERSDSSDSDSILLMKSAYVSDFRLVISTLTTPTTTPTPATTSTPSLVKTSQNKTRENITNL